MDFWATIKEKEPTTLPDGRQLKDVLLMRWMVSCVAAVLILTAYQRMVF